jgi:hypothetical protein
MSRRKRASMREGPLADLFRSTTDDADERSPAGPVAGEDSSSSPEAAGEQPTPAPPTGEAASSDEGRLA